MDGSPETTMPTPFGLTQQSRRKDGLQRARDARRRLLSIAAWSTFGPVTHKKQAFIADAYEEAEHRPGDPEVKRSYRAFIAETHRQFYAAELNGLRIEPWLDKGQPYPGCREMLADVRDNNHLYVFLGGELPTDHPLAQFSPATLGSYQLTNNIVFRATHDIYGHGYGCFGFDAYGEEMAWRSHAAMYSAEALPALTAETRGQAAWFFYGSHLRRPDGSIPEERDDDFIPWSGRPFAPQKATLLPPDCWLA